MRSANLRNVGAVSNAEASVRELLLRSREPLTGKQIAARLHYGEATVWQCLDQLCASGEAKRRKNLYKPRFPFEYMAYSTPWPEQRTSKGEVRAAQ